MLQCKIFPRATFVTAVLGLALVVEHASGQDFPVSPYIDRPLDLPQLESDEQCPVSIGDMSVVSSDHRYIFGAGGHFYGTGPVYLALSWKPGNRAEAFFDLDRVPQVSNGYRLKTPWIMNPEYDGEALVRGAQIGTDVSREVLFAENSQSPRITAAMILRSSAPGTRILRSEEEAVDAVWGFWPSSMILPAPGCYAIQIDTETDSDVVIFEAELSQ